MYTNRVGKIADLEDMLGADVYFLIHNRRSDGSIDGTMIDVLRKMIRFTRRREKAALVIQTPGGYADEAYYIGEFFREYYDKTEAYVVSDCYSGGTMIALSTDRIYLSHSGCLGPIDIQRYYAGNDKEDSWYPAPSGLIEALRKAKEENEIDESLEKTFKGKMSVLATYFKDKYTYADLVGENVKRHCICGKDWNEVWKYLSALNFSHGTPLTYRRLKEIGLQVELMDDVVEEAIKVVIRDIEHEFGDLVERSYLYNFFKNPLMDMDAKKCGNNEDDNETADDETEEDDSKEGKKYYEGRHQYRKDTTDEILAVIETAIMGFMQSREMGIVFEDCVPRYMAEISSGWEEETNMSEVTPDERQKLDTIVSFFASTGSESIGIEFEEADDSQKQKILNVAYSNLKATAIEAIKNEGYAIEDVPNSQLCKMVVNYITCNPNVIVFDDQIEELLKNFVESRGIPYDTLDGATKIEMYYELWEACENIVITKLGIDAEEYDKLPEDKRIELISELMMSGGLRFRRVEN